MDAEPLVGEQTRLTLRNFPGPGRRVGDVPEFVAAYARVKAAAARANAALGVLDPGVASAIEAACAEVAAGRHAAAFPTPLVVGGGGTATNLNVDEVLASLAGAALGRTVHPLDDVNASQSTNDTYPTAMALAVLDLARPALAELGRLAAALRERAAAFDGVEHLGRTCLRDAVVLTAGQTHRAQAAMLDRCATALRDALGALHHVPLGATAIGTGVGAPPGYAERAVAELATLTGLPLVPSADPFDALAHLDEYARVASACALAAGGMARVAADLRLWSSGPVGGFGDLTLPVAQAGSSIMPGKVNPTVPEHVMQLSFRVRGAAHTVDLAVAAGELELNVMEPVVLDALVTMLADVAAAAATFTDNCVAGLAWDGPRLGANAAGAVDGRVLRARTVGYDEIAHEVVGLPDHFRARG